MAKGTVIRWQRKEQREGHSFTSVKLSHGKSEGLTEVTSWLDTSTPDKVLEDLRDYQENWCSHIYKPVAVVRKGDVVHTISSCSECSHVKKTKRAAVSG